MTLVVLVVTAAFCQKSGGHVSRRIPRRIFLMFCDMVGMVLELSWTVVVGLGWIMVVM